MILGMAWYLIVPLAAVGLALLALGWMSFSRFAAGRDWIYHEKHNPRPEGLSSLGLLEEIYQPSISHVVEEETSQKAWQPGRVG